MIKFVTRNRRRNLNLCKDLSNSEDQKLGKRERDDLEDGEYEGGKEESRKR